MRVGVLHGPNLNLLGRREPGIYGRQTLAEINAELEEAARELGCVLRISQHNGEGELVEAIQALGDWAEAIVINPAAYTHYSVAVADALRAVALPAVEVHLSNPEAREEYRRVSLVAPVCVAKVAGFGGFGYRLALMGAVRLAQARRLAREKGERA
ncbi:MAG TPA: type II 3-dehydroquinate dehydratase [Firmicutes bacterium]|nr:type II 3-dehydroquinate dehydratase [Bacillota bacterium]